MGQVPDTEDNIFICLIVTTCIHLFTQLSMHELKKHSKGTHSVSGTVPDAGDASMNEILFTVD